MALQTTEDKGTDKSDLLPACSEFTDLGVALPVHHQPHVAVHI